MITYFKNIYEYREMLKNLVKKDLRTRYKGSVLGFMWTFVNPLLQLFVYTIIFSTIMRININNFPMFLFVALLPWIFFSNTLLMSSMVIIQNNSLIKKIYFPREILPTAVVIGAFINLLFSLLIVIPCLIIFGIGISKALIYLPLVLLIEFLFALGMALTVSALNVYFRDLEHMISIFTMMWFYFTPIIFPIEMVPKEYLRYFFINPMTPIIVAFRDILYYKTAPNLISLCIIFFSSLLFVVFGYNLFNKLQRNFAEEV